MTVVGKELKYTGLLKVSLSDITNTKIYHANMLMSRYLA